MDSLSPHVDFRVADLHREAEARRLAASASAPRNGRPPRRGRRGLAIATAILAVAAAVGAPSAYIAAAGAGSLAPVDQMIGQEPVVETGQARLPLPKGGGIRLHR